MKIADLFIAIGISGATETKNTLSDTKKGLNEAGSSALLTKAAIVGVLYGLEQLVSTSNRAGAELSLFGNYTGLSAEKMQRYAWAGRQANATTEEVKGSVLGLQKAMAQLETTGQGPAGLWVVSKEVGLDRNRLRDTFYVLEQLQKFANTTKLPTGIANQALESFGLSAGTISAMRQNAFNPEQLAKANVYTDKETAALARMNAQWGNLADNWEKMIGRLNEKHGGQLIHDLMDISIQIEKLVNSLATAADKLKLFKLASGIFKEAATDVSVLTALFQIMTGQRSSDDVYKQFMQMKKEGNQPILAKLFETPTGAERVNSEAAFKRWVDSQHFSGSPNMKGELPGQYGPPVINQVQNFYGPTDPKAAGAAAKSGAKDGVSDSTWQSQAHRRKH